MSACDEVSTGRRIRFVSIGVKGDWAFARKASGLESGGVQIFHVFLSGGTLLVEDFYDIWFLIYIFKNKYVWCIVLKELLHHWFLEFDHDIYVHLGGSGERNMRP